MRRSSTFFIGFAAAAITYLSLLQFAGYRNVDNGGLRAYGGHRQMHCERFHSSDQDKHSPNSTRHEKSYQPNPANNNNY
jgi:hypothetical protein